MLLTEGKSGFEAQTEDVRESAFTLSTLDPTQTGPSAFQQISFNPSDDINASVMSDGRILYTRWSHTRLQVTNGMHLYTVNPDGTDDELLFGAHSHFVGTADPATGLPTAVQYVKAREMQDGRVMAIIRPADSGTDFGGNLVILDVQTSVECFQRLLAAGPVVAGSNRCPPLTPATTNDVRTIPGPSPGGRFNSAYPLWDGTGRILVSWEECRLLNSSGVIVACTDANLAAPERTDRTAPVQRLAAQPGQQYLQARRTPYRGGHAYGHRHAPGPHAAAPMLHRSAPAPSPVTASELSTSAASTTGPTPSIRRPYLRRPMPTPSPA